MRFTIIAFLLCITSAFGQNLTIHCINVGWGDCTLIESPSGEKLMVDAGHYWSRPVGMLTEYLHSIDVDTIDYLIATHYHADHIGGVNNVVDSGFVFLNAFDRGYEYDSGQYDEYYNAVSSIRDSLDDGRILDLGGGVTVEIVSVNGNGLWLPPHDVESRENAYSVAMIVDYNDFQFFVGGDLTENVELTLVDEDIPQVDAYRVNHHCSNSSNCQDFLDHIQPQVSIISCGPSQYDFPDSAAYSRLEQISTVYQTETDDGVAIDGDIVIETTGFFFFDVNGDRYDLDSTSIKTETSFLPNTCHLSQNYPNPFNSETSIEYQLSQDAHVMLTVYDILGKEVEILIDESKPPGVYRYKWDADGFASGIYFYRLQAGNYSRFRKMILIK